MSGMITATVGGAVLGSVIGAKGAEGAAETQAGASRYAADIGQQQYEQTREDLMPWQRAGESALAQYSGYGRSQVDPSQYIPQSAIPQYDPTVDLTQDPSYQWRQAEQERMINRNMAGMGKVTSGNRLEEIMRRSGEMASQEYGAARARGIEDYTIGRGIEAEQYGRGIDEYGRAYGEESDYLNRLAALSKVGQTTATGMGQFGAASAAQQGAAAQQAAAAQAAGQIGTASAWQGAIGDISSIAGRYDPNITTVTTDYSADFPTLPLWTG
jgi:hypothetical protein